MGELIIPVDPVAKAIAYLGPMHPDVRMALDVPSDWAWDDTLVVVVDVGGAGPVGVVLDDVFLMVEVSSPDDEKASELARLIYGQLRGWQWKDPGVSWVSSLQRPTYSPDEDTRSPGYAMTVNLRFRAEIRRTPDA